MKKDRFKDTKSIDGHLNPYNYMSLWILKNNKVE